MVRRTGKFCLKPILHGLIQYMEFTPKLLRSPAVQNSVELRKTQNLFEHQKRVLQPTQEMLVQRCLCELTLEASNPFTKVPFGPEVETADPVLAPLRKSQVRLFSESLQEHFIFIYTRTLSAACAFFGSK